LDEGQVVGGKFDVGPCAFLHGKLFDPIGVIAPVGKPHRGGGGMSTIPPLSGDKQTSGERAATAAFDPPQT
jgi:hypothetical protein